MDIGQRVVDYVDDRMQIDDQWAVRSQGRFAWWAGGLAQRVWAEAASEREGALVTQVHIETDLLRKIVRHRRRSSVSPASIAWPRSAPTSPTRVRTRFVFTRP